MGTRQMATRNEAQAIVANKEMQDVEWRITIKFLKHAFNGAGTATAAHGDVEFVVVV